MTFDEFVSFRNVKIKNKDHKRVVNAFYGYLSSVTGDSTLLSNEIGRILAIDLSGATVETGCFNGMFNGTNLPYEDVDFYVKLSNNIYVFIFGMLPAAPLKELKENEYVVFILSNDTNGTIKREINRHIYIH